MVGTESRLYTWANRVRNGLITVQSRLTYLNRVRDRRIAFQVLESRPRSSNRVSSPRIAFQVLESRPRSSNRVSSRRIAFQVLESRPRSSNRVPVFKPNSLPFSATVAMTTSENRGIIVISSESEDGRGSSSDPEIDSDLEVTVKRSR